MNIRLRVAVALLPWRAAGCFYLFGLLAASLFGLNPSRPITQYTLRTWQSDAGLPQDSVLALIQSRDGYIWAATYDGLVQFDGRVFTLFHSRNTPAFKVNPVFTLLQDSGGRIWAGTTGGGLVKLERRVFHRFGFGDGLPSEEITFLYEDRRGRLWVGTASGLARREGDRFLTVDFGRNLPEGAIWAVLEDRLGNLWVGANGGLFTVRADGSPVTLPPGLHGLAVPVRALMEDDRGRVWIGTYGHGLICWDGRTVADYGTRNKALASDVVRALRQDADGNIWIGTGGGGLYRYGADGFSRLTTLDGFTSDVIWALLEDHEGNLWAGTGGGGLCQLTEPKILTLTKADGLASNHVWTVLEDREGNIWVGTNGAGLNRLGNPPVVYTTRDGLVDNFVRSLCTDRQGRLWIGSQAGLSCLEHGCIREPLRVRASIRAILEDRRGVLWVGTAGAGLFRVSGRVITRLTTADGMSDNVVSTIYESPRGDLWIGTRAGITQLRDDGRMARVVDVLCRTDAILCIFQDSLGDCWVGTSGNGVLRIHGGGVQRMPPDERLLDDEIYQVLEDSRGNLWMSSNHGLFEVDRSGLCHYLESGRERPAIHQFGIADGLRGTEFNGNNLPAGIRDRSGRLWFPSLTGLAVVDPGAIRINAHPPRVVIERIVAGPREIPGDAGPLPSFTYRDKSYEFHYTALSFTNPSRVKFKYRLDGYDEDWIDAGTRRVAYYTNLGPGRYTFRVIGCNNDGLWNTRGATLCLDIRPAFWMTDWFRASAFLLGAIFVNVVVFWIKRLFMYLRYWRQTHTIGPYRILEVIGRGGMGKVYKATRQRSRKILALKVLDEGQMDAEAHQRFIREGLICERLTDSNVIRILDRGCHRGRAYYVMEYYEGVTLREFMESRALSPRLCLVFLDGLAAIVQRIHQAGIIHRDLKPDNIMVGQGFQADDTTSVAELRRQLRSNLKILDFGLSKVVGHQNLTRTGTLLGTVHYLPPEYLSGARVENPGVDFYSLGVIFYELLTGRKPYQGDEPTEVLFSALTTRIAAPGEIRPGIPLEISDLALRLIAREAEGRLSTYAGLAEQVERLLAPGGTGAAWLPQVEGKDTIER